MQLIVTETSVVIPATSTATATNTALPVVASIIVGSATGEPGTEVTFDTSLETEADNVAGVQVDIGFAADAPIAANDNDRPDCTVNPAIDIGQVEGAFIQGMGWLTTEELWWNKDGVLMTHAPSTYKIPSVNDCPADFRTRLYKNSNVEDTIHRSKATGEPPLLLPFSVFFAIRDAISWVGGHRVDPPLQAPATPEAVLRAINAARQA